MINLKQFVKLIPYYQDYEVWYAKYKFDDYICVLDEIDICINEEG